MLFQMFTSAPLMSNKVLINVDTLPENYYVFKSKKNKYGFSSTQTFI